MPIKSNFHLLIILLTILFPTLLSAEKVKIVIPVIIPLTGNASEQGIWVKEGLELAQTQINKSSEIDLELIFEDSQMNTNVAISAYRQLQTSYDFPAIITMGSGIGLALSPIVNQDQIIQMGVATETEAYSSKGDYNFRNFPSSLQGASFATKYFTEKLKAKNVAIIKIENEYGMTAAKTFQTQFMKEPKSKIVYEAIIQPGDNNFRSQLVRVRQSNPDAIYLISYPNEGALVLKQAKQLGITSPILATPAIIGSNNFIELSNQGAEGISIMTMTPLTTNNQRRLTKKFIEDFEKHFSRKPPVQAFLITIAYDAIKMIANGLSHCKSNSSVCLKDYLSSLTNYVGAGSTISFDEYGDIEAEFAILKVNNGQFQLQP